jgi:hypothetical protein
MTRFLVTVAGVAFLSTAALAAEEGAVGGPVGAAVGAGVGHAATGPDRTVERRSGCSHTTVRKENDLGESKTVHKEECD